MGTDNNGPNKEKRAGKGSHYSSMNLQLEIAQLYQQIVRLFDLCVEDVDTRLIIKFTD